MAKPELGIKRVCGSCGSKFYDLNRDPIVCPKCGTVYQVVTAARARPETRAVAEEEPEPVKPANVEIVSLEEADAEATGKKKVPATADAEGEEDVEIPAAAEDDTFLEEEEEEPGNVSDIIGEKLEDDEET